MLLNLHMPASFLTKRPQVLNLVFCQTCKVESYAFANLVARFLVPNAIPGGAFSLTGFSLPARPAQLPRNHVNVETFYVLKGAADSNSAAIRAAPLSKVISTYCR